MKKTNLNLLFNKTYYDYFDQTDRPGFDDEGFLDGMKESLAGKNKDLFKADFYNVDDYVENPIATNRFILKTTYPGAIIGIGYVHGMGIEGLENDINCGFSFDFVSGQPYYPATSVKGVLRSAFEHKEVISSILKKMKNDEKSLSENAVKALENSIFGDDEQKTEGVDVFFDAVVKFVIRKDKRKRKLLMSSEYITSHGDDPTKNPVPVMITKILPNIVFEFRFKLSNSVIGDVTVTAKEKENLFIEILKLLGMGAKTNVGYGALVEPDGGEIEKIEEELLMDKRPQEETTRSNTESQNNQSGKNSSSQSNKGNKNIDAIKPKEGISKPKKGSICEGVVEFSSGNMITLKIDGKSYKMLISGIKGKISKGQKLKIEITDDHCLMADLVK